MKSIAEKKVNQPKSELLHVEIPKKLSPFKSSRKGCKPEYIVIHYTGSPFQGIDRTVHYMTEYQSERSAHYIVDGERIAQVVPINDAAWHVSDGSVNRRYERGKDAEAWHNSEAGSAFRGNRNSIGIELCVTKTDKKSVKVGDTDWHFTEGTLGTAAKLVAALMDELDIPIDHVIRHMDATGKPCPRPLVSLKSDGNKDCDTTWACFLMTAAILHNEESIRLNRIIKKVL